MKYIMIESIIGGGTKYTPIIFPDDLIHSCVAEHAVTMLIKEHGWTAVVRSAGFITGDFKACFGNSETLKIGHHADDADIIHSYNYLHGLGFEEGGHAYETLAMVRRLGDK